MNKLARNGIIEQARSVRFSTAWTLVLITNIQYIVYSPVYPLGQAYDLPNNLKLNKYLNMYIKPHIMTVFLDV